MSLFLLPHIATTTPPTCVLHTKLAYGLHTRAFSDAFSNDGALLPLTRSNRLGALLVRRQRAYGHSTLSCSSCRLAPLVILASFFVTYDDENDCFARRSVC